jgi:hypothetical protein
MRLMVYFIVIWTLLSIGCCCSGLGLIHLLKIMTDWRAGDRAIVATWLGILAISITLLATSLLLPLSPQIGGCLLLGGTLSSLGGRSSRSEIFTLYRRISRGHLLLYLSIAIAIAALFLQPVSWVDAGIYHYSLIRWLSNFGTVPGLSLLMPHLGFTSVWFAFAAPLNPDGAIDRAGSTVNGFVFLLAILQLVMSITRLLRQQARLSDWFMIAYYNLMLLVGVAVYWLRLILVSTSPDIPALLLVAITTWAILVVETAPIEDRFTPRRQIVPLLLAIGAVSIKLTQLPLLCVTGLWLIVRAGLNRQVWRRMGIVGVASLLLIPFFMSSIVTSGCPTYPSPALCLDLPWTIQNNTAIVNSTHHWISWYGTPPAGVNPWLWGFQFWIKKPFNIFITAKIAMFISYSIYLLKTRGQNVDWRGGMWLMAIAAAGIGLFLNASPLYRFMLPYLLIAPALAIANYYRNLSTIESIVNKLPLFRFVNLDRHRAKIATIAILSIVTAIQVRSDYSMLVVPPAVDRIATIKRQVNDVVYLAPIEQKKRCWTTELPCTHIPRQIRLRQPQAGIKAGFIN